MLQMFAYWDNLQAHKGDRMNYFLAPNKLTKEQHEWLTDESNATLESKAAIIRRLIQEKVNTKARRQKKCVDSK